MLHFPLAAAAQPDLMSTVQSFLPLIFLFAMLYFMILRPKQRDEKRRREMLSELKKGDRVLLMSGMYGRVVKTGETVFTVELAKGFTVEVERNAIAAKVDNTAENTASE